MSAIRKSDVSSIWFPPSANGNGAESASGELSRYMSAIARKQIQSVPFFDWPITTSLTQALIPGSITMIVGDPGVGKTFLVLQALRGWVANRIPVAVMFIEKDRKFHLHRLLAQLEKNGNMIDWPWCAEHPDEVYEAVQRHGDVLDELGDYISFDPQDGVSLGSVGNWVRQKASAGCRIIVVDPITAVDAGDQRWKTDREFMLGMVRMLTETGSSLILVTHSKGSRPQNRQPGGYDQAGSAAFFRHSDTDIWVKRENKPRKVTMRRSKIEPAWDVKLDLFFQIHKARNGRGRQREVGFVFGHDLMFAEQGVVMKPVVNEQEAQQDAPKSEPDPQQIAELF